MNLHVEELVTDTRPLTETDLFRSYWDDGLLDILCGLAVLVTGLGWTGGLGPLAVVQAPLWIVLWPPLRHRIVEPRAGFVRFSLSRRQRTSRRLWQTAGLGLVALALTAAAIVVVPTRGPEPMLRSLSAGLPAVLVAVPASLAALLTGARRFLAYALVLVAGAVVTVVVEAGPAPPLTAAGLVAVGAGAGLLARFLRASREYLEGRRP